MAAKASTEIMNISKLPLSDEEESRQFVSMRDRHAPAWNTIAVVIEFLFDEYPCSHEGCEDKDVSNILTEMVLNWVDTNNMKLVPYCPFVKTYLRRNTAWQRLLVKGVQV